MLCFNYCRACVARYARNRTDVTMIILSHRGYWKAAKKKNTLAVFERSFSLALPSLRIASHSKLNPMQPRIHAVLCQQFTVLADLDYLALLQHDDAIRFFDGG